MLSQSTCYAGHVHSISGLGRFPGGGNGNPLPLQYSCLGNPTDRGAWRATVHGVTKSRTRLKRLSMYTCDKSISREREKGVIQEMRVLGGQTSSVVTRGALSLEFSALKFFDCWVPVILHKLSDKILPSSGSCCCSMRPG